jgi:hypothetical protein
MFRSRESGRITVAQWPNLSLAVVLTCDVARWLLHPHGAIAQTLRWTGAAALLWWSLDEIIRGVNPFRRILGIVLLARLVVGIVAPGVALG